MSNSGLISRMERILDGFESGPMKAYDVEQAIDFHIVGLEKMSISTVHKARDLMHRLVISHFTDGDDEFIDAEKKRLYSRNSETFCNLCQICESYNRRFQPLTSSL